MNNPTALGADHAVGSNGQVGIGVLGARSMVARLAVLPAIDASSRAHLVAAASLSGPIPEPWDAKTVESYEAVIDHPDVDAVYIPLPNGMHEEWVERCAAAGKHVLCEKPLAPDSETARRMKQTADQAGILLAEAWMTPFDPRWAEAIRLASSGLVGRITELRSAFTFTIGPEAADNYRWDPAQGGGALLDVGIYCLGPAVQLWGADPVTVNASTITAAGGVDASTAATLTWPGGEVASINCSFIDDEEQRLELVGTDGVLTVDRDAHTGGHRASDIELTTSDGTTSVITAQPGDPYLAMVDAFAQAVAATGTWDRPVDDSIAMLELVGRIADAASVTDPAPSNQTHSGPLPTQQIDDTPT
jgi:xylose dehydrogenase (NAD/NADP)